MEASESLVLCSCQSQGAGLCEWGEVTLAHFGVITSNCYFYSSTQMDPWLVSGICGGSICLPIVSQTDLLVTLLLTLVTGHCLLMTLPLTLVVEHCLLRTLLLTLSPCSQGTGLCCFSSDKASAVR